MPSSPAICSAPGADAGDFREFPDPWRELGTQVVDRLDRPGALVPGDLGFGGGELLSG
jgi:hypothetical protein